MSVHDAFAEHLTEHAEVVAWLDDVAREDWLELRRTGVGASDAAAVLGVSPWRSAYTAWAERCGLVAPTPTTPAMGFGSFVEPWIYARYTEHTGRPAVAANVLARSLEHPFMLCTPDAVTVDGGQLGLIEAKSVNHRQADKWGPDRAPIDYVAQAMHQIVVCHVDFVDLVPLMLDTRDIGEPVRIRYEDDIARELIAREAAWWDHVVHRTAPPVDATVSTEDTLRARWDRHVDGATVELDDEQAAWWQVRVDLRARIRELEDEERAVSNALRAVLGDAAAATHQGRPLLTYRAHEVRELDEKRLRHEEPELFERYARTRTQRTLRPAPVPRKRKAKP